MKICNLDEGCLTISVNWKNIVPRKQVLQYFFDWKINLLYSRRWRAHTCMSLARNNKHGVRQLASSWLQYYSTTRWMLVCCYDLLNILKYKEKNICSIQAVNISMKVLDVNFVPSASLMQHLFYFFLLGRHYGKHVTMFSLLSPQTSHSLPCLFILTSLADFIITRITKHGPPPPYSMVMLVSPFIIR
jgi:hypothetical protein